MAIFSRVTPWGWEQGNDSAASSRVTPGGWEQVVSTGGGSSSFRVLKVEAPWDSQPQEAVELARELGSVDHRASGTLPLDGTGLLSASYTPQGVALAPSAIVGPQGRGVRFSGAESVAFTPPTGTITSEDYAIVVVVRRGATVGTAQAVFGTTNASGSAYRTVGFGTTNNAQALFRDSGSTRNLTGTTTFAAGELVSMVLVSRSDTDKVLFANGLLEDNTISGPKTGGGAVFVLGAYGQTSGQANWLDGDVFLAAYLPNVASLSNEYFRNLSANPWQVFAPRTLWIPITVASGVGRLYYVIGPNAGWSTPTAAEIMAGQLSGGSPATASGNEISPTVTTDPFTFSADATGLTAGTDYRVAYVWSDE